MKLQPMFYQGQAVVCIDSDCLVDPPDQKCPLIEGKRYYVTNPDLQRDHDTIYIELAGISEWGFDQDQFVPEEADRATEEMIHEALKGAKILNHNVN